MSGYQIQAKSNFSWALLPFFCRFYLPSNACCLHIFAWFAWKMFLNIGSKDTKLLANFRLRLSRSTWFAAHPEGHAFWSSPPNNQVILCLSFSGKPKWTLLLVSALAKTTLKGYFRDNYQQTLLRNVTLYYCRGMCSSSCRFTVNLLKSPLYLL